MRRSGVDLACNYSPHLMRLLDAGTVCVDWVKLSRREVLDQEMADVAGRRPILLHTLAHLGSRSLLDGDPGWPACRERLREAGSPHVGVHLAVHPGDLDGEPSLERIRERVAANVRTLRAELPVPILIENQPFYPTRGTVRSTVDPEFVRAVAEETGAGLLLDTAHVRVASAQLGIDASRSLRLLPLELVREVHVAGSRPTPTERLVDRHHELLEEDYSFLAEALELCSPGILTLEYGGTGPKYDTPERNSPEALERQLRRLERVARGADGA